MKYRVVLLDADGTLFDYDRAEASALEQAMGGAGVDYDPELHLPTYREINRALWNDFERGLITAERLKTERFRRLGEQLGMEIDARAISQCYQGNLAKASFLLPGAEKLVADLAREYHLVLLTNGLSMVQRSRLQQSPISRYFTGVIISEEVGVAKPNPGIFKLALETIGHEDKTSVLMVGDSLESDIQGGANSGIDTCWYNPSGRQNLTGPKPTYEVQDFEELRRILGLDTTEKQQVI